MTQSTLAERAAAKAGRAEQPPAAEPEHNSYVPEELPDFDEFEPGVGDPEQVPPHIAWNRVMREIRAIEKGGKGGQFRSAKAGNYDFRGVDRTVNAFGPALRKHGVIVAPVNVTATYTGKSPRECSVVVKWQIIGPMGDTMPGLWESAGEAMDFSDKSTAKAQSVALRVLLLTAAMVPTGDPDPDATNPERGASAPDRGEAPARTPESYRDEILDPKTSHARINQIGYELGRLRMLNRVVENEVGEQETLESIGTRKLAERAR